ncbi:MAG: hypothetical protein JNL58_11650 [Planctomyces sp.]|nr:hypothetical protein [Planctomyces sp.]
MTAILGVSAWYHDSAAALLINGRPVAAAQEERFSRVRHDPGFPIHAIEYCLSEGGISPADLDFAGFYEKPVRHFDRLNESWLAGVPFGYPAFRLALPQWLRRKLKTPAYLNSSLNEQFGGRSVFIDHHESHAASAFFASPFEEAAILTIDGVGEWTTTSVGIGQGNRITRINELRFPHSLGLLYSAFAEYLGFRVNSGEYKVMGLAPYGSPVFAEKIRTHLIDLRDDGSFRLDQTYFRYISGLRMTGSRFHCLFGGPPRKPESEITQYHKDIAASIQLVTEEVILNVASYARRVTNQKNLVLAGGVALNCVANGRLQRTSPTGPLWIQPAAGDAGGALGTALFIYHQLLEHPRQISSEQASGEPVNDQMSFARLGPQFSDDDIRSLLHRKKARSTEYADDLSLCHATAELLASQNVVGWFQGRMEYGPRALGGRSILADPRNPSMQTHLNRSIKMRETFRPFAPAILHSEAHKWFEIPCDEHSPYMLSTAFLRKDLPSSFQWNDEMPAWRDSISLSPFPAVTHVDGSARLQTVSEQQDPRFQMLLAVFHQRTRCPALVNTSFNVRGEPIVCTPDDAWNCFCRSELDALVMGKFLILRSEQSADFADEVRSSGSSFPTD